MSKTPASFLDLPDNCMLKIFSRLQLAEILKLHLVFKRWEKLIKDITPKRYLNTRVFFMGCAANEAEEILVKFGPLVKELVLEQTAVEFHAETARLADCFRNIETLRFCGINEPRAITKNFTAATQNLKTLEYMFSPSDDDVLADIAQWTTVQNLNFTCSKSVTGNHVHALKNVVYLNLNGCKGITTKAFVQICKSLKLKILNIIGCDQLDEDSFEALGETQSELRTICMSHMYETSNLGCIAQIKSLKRLALHQEPEYDNQLDLLEDFVKSENYCLDCLEIYEDPFSFGFNLTAENRGQIMQFKNLTKLHLCFLSRVPAQALIEIVEALPNLTYVNIMGMRVVDITVLLNIITVCKNLEKLNISQLRYFNSSHYQQIVDTLVVNGSKPVTMNVIYTGFEESFHWSPEYLENKHRLKLIFKSDDLFSPDEYME